MKKIKKYLKKLNIFDVIGISIFFIILGIAGMFFLRKGSYVYVTLHISKGDNYSNRWDKPAHWYIENLSKGFSEKDALGRVKAEVNNVYYYPENKKEQDVFVTVKVRTTYNSRSDQHSYQGQPLLIGSHHNFKIGSISIPGLVHSVREEGEVAETKEVYVRGILENEENEEFVHDANIIFSGVKNVISSNLKEGMTIKNSNETLEVLKIEDVAITPSYKEFVSGNRVIKVLDVERKDVEITAKLKLHYINGVYLFREEDLVLLNEPLRLDFKEFTIHFTPIEISESPFE